MVQGSCVESQNERFFFQRRNRNYPDAAAIHNYPVKKSDLIALAETMISSSFPALRGMTLKVKIVDTEDYVMSVSLEGEGDSSRREPGRRRTDGAQRHGRGSGS